MSNADQIYRRRVNFRGKGEFQVTHRRVRTRNTNNPIAPSKTGSAEVAGFQRSTPLDHWVTSLPMTNKCSSVSESRGF